MGNRLFVSVDLDGLAGDVAAAQAPLEGLDGLSLTDPAQAHVTLKFLGDVEPDRITALRSALEAAVAESGVTVFEAEFGGLGVFPSLEYITVVWLGVGRGGDALTTLHRAIESRTTAMGFEAEDHAFTPHVTIARMNHAAQKDRVRQHVTEGDPQVGALTVDAVRLTRSTLEPDGPSYETVAAVPLPR